MTKRFSKGHALALGLALAACTTAHAVDTGSDRAAATPRYTFSYPLGADRPAPRGGVTRGAPVVLDTAPSAAWQALQAPGLSASERDRRAIVAMAGTFRVAFDFVEVATFGGSTPLAPYQSWATEKVYVDRDEPGFVSLVHVLEVHVVGDDGAIGEPIVTKHWRQDWRYEPDAIVEYRGMDRWQRRTLRGDERRGAWMQSVHQVDESPRYASLGKWRHTASFSTWISGDTWRPLPRREWTVRDDYQVLLGTNRHTVGPTGWLQEEDNLKAVLSAPGRIDGRTPYRAREYGLARYERIAPGDGFAAADRYYEATRAFWDDVVAQWDDDFVREGAIALRGPVDKLGLYGPLFEQAERVADAGERVRPEEIRGLLRSMRAPR